MAGNGLRQSRDRRSSNKSGAHAKFGVGFFVLATFHGSGIFKVDHHHFGLNLEQGDLNELTKGRISEGKTMGAVARRMGCTRRPRDCPLRAFGHLEECTLVAVMHLAVFSQRAASGSVRTVPHGWLDREYCKAVQVTASQRKSAKSIYRTAWYRNFER
jgi:hypothetical protein